MGRGVITSLGVCYRFSYDFWGYSVKRDRIKVRGEGV